MLCDDDSLYINRPVAGCAFFGTPQRADKAYSMNALTAILYASELKSASMHWRKLNQQNAILDSVNRSFRDCCDQHSLRTIACYETKQTKGIGVVSYIDE